MTNSFQATDSGQLTEAQKLRAFKSLEYMSIVHSFVYLGLLAIWIFDGPAALRAAFGWAHGILWIVMTLLVVIAARMAIVSFRLAVLVAVIGGLGPFAGTAGFLWEGRRRNPVNGEISAETDSGSKSR